jgi:hypothetical protein
MKKLFISLFIVLNLIVICLSATKLLVTEVPEKPKWVADYFNQIQTPTKYIQEGELGEVINSKYNVKIYVEKKKENSYVLMYQKGKNVQKLLTSKISFTNQQWSKDKLYFSIVNLTYDKEIYSGDIYIYHLQDNKLNLIYFEQAMGANPGGFSNGNKYFAYWSNTKHGLCIVNLKTKKNSILKVPLARQGFASSIAWRKDDEAIYITYVIDDIGKDYVISNLKY